YRVGHSPKAEHVSDRQQQGAKLVAGPGRERSDIQPSEERLLIYVDHVQELFPGFAEQVNDQRIATERFKKRHPASPRCLGDDLNKDRERGQVNADGAQNVGTGPKLLINWEDRVP